MTRTFSDGHPKVLPACNFLSQYYFYNIFLQKSCRFSLQTLTKFKAAKTGSGVGFLRLTAVWSQSINWNAHNTILSRGRRLFRRRITCSSCIAGAPSNQNRARERFLSVSVVVGNQYSHVVSVFLTNSLCF